MSQTMTAEQKLNLMKQEYDIPVDRRGIRDEVKIMCNLSEGVEEMGYAKGEAAGRAIGRSEGRLEGKSEERADIILKMHKKGYSLEQIMDVTEMSEAEISKILLQSFSNHYPVSIQLKNLAEDIKGSNENMVTISGTAVHLNDINHIELIKS